MEDNTINNMNNNVNPKDMGGTDNNKKTLVVPLISIIISFMIIVISIIAIVLLLKEDNQKEKPKVKIEEVEDEVTHKINGSEVDAFYERKDVLGESSVEEENTFSEEEVIQLLTERGLYNEETASLKIITKYDINGNHLYKKEISSTSKEKHPEYSLVYNPESRNPNWEILVTGKDIIALPLAHDTIKNVARSNYVIEKESVLSYDSETHKFFRNILSEDLFALTKVKKIDKQTIEQLANTKFKE